MSKKKSLKEKFLQAGLEPKKVIIYLLVADLFVLGFAALSYFVLKTSLIISVAMVCLIPLIDYYSLMKMLQGKGKDNVALETEFVRVFGYLNIYLHNGLPVYTGINNIIEFSSKEMKNRLRKLLKEIDEDKSVAPYISFSSGFPSLLVKEVMVSLYLISEQGGVETYMPQFEKTFDQLASEKRKADKERRIEKLNTLCFLPLIGAGSSMLMIVSGIVVLMRSMTDVI